jgi:hypothetical protein
MGRRFILAVLLAASSIVLAGPAAAQDGESLTLCLNGPGGTRTVTTPYDLGSGTVLTTSFAEFVLDRGGDFTIVGTPEAGEYQIRLGRCGGKRIAVIPDIDSAFACYGNGGLGDPGVWPIGTAAVFPDWETIAPGYWAPYASKTVPSNTKLGEYYLLCYLPSGMKATGEYIGGDGAPVVAGPPFLNGGAPIPGVYRVIG